jgi:hypothetical protein
VNDHIRWDDAKRRLEAQKRRDESRNNDVAAAAFVAVVLFIVWAASMAALGWFAYLMYFWIAN